MSTPVSRPASTSSLTPSVAADERRMPISIDSQFALRLPSDPRIAPDGARVAFVLSEWVANQPKARARIWMVDTTGGEPRPFTNGPRADSCPRWSPDGLTLAFCSEREGDNGKPQLYVIPASGGEPRRVCTMPNGVADLAWSPDGTRIAFTSEEGPQPARDPLVVDAGRHRRLWTVRVTSDTPEPVTPPNLTVWRYEWAPGGDRLALFFADAPGETAWYQGQLGIVSSTGGGVRQLGALAGQAAAFAWSPDGRQLAYVAGEWSDRPLVGGDLWVVDVEDGTPRNLTPDAKVSVSWAGWLPGGQELLLLAWDRVWNLVGTVGSAGGPIVPLAREVVLGEGAWPRLSATTDGTRFAVLRMDPTTPPEIWLGSVTLPARQAAGQRSGSETAAGRADIDWRRLTHVNALPEATLAVAPVEALRYPGADGWPIDALLVMPREPRRGTPPPLIVMVHGGPSAANRAAYGGLGWAHQWAAAGFAVLQPNFRGSLGRGVAFADAILGDMGGKDLDDVLLGVDHLVASGRVDGTRLGIMGWSYGGFATEWAVTQTTRFKAAVAGAGICDFHSFHAQSNIPDWDRRFLGA
ncbi:MAG TPA: S9 family peptidase, partial [Ktedonobacterales bacterium]|nr:S9 family peptidase [Ktedonobacterales bacterium]